MTRVAVVIPYYQREAGLLGRAIRSVLRQEGTAPPAVVVVDDGSPHDPSAEIAGLDPADRARVTLIRQANAGPGAARNTGLDHLAGDPPDFVAFLDSDDSWEADHLRSALDGLGETGDVYFDDHDRAQYPGESSYFHTDDRLGRWRRLGALIPIGEGCLRIRPDMILRPFMEDYLAQTSTIVFRFQTPMADVRFEPALRSLGEDLLFLLELAGSAREVRLADRIGVHCGVGVSIFHSALSWDHPDAPMRFAMSLLLWRTVRDRIVLDAGQRHYVDGKIAGFKRGFAYIWLRHAWRTRRPHRASAELVRQRLGLHPLYLAPSLAGIAYRLMRRQPAFPEH